MATQDSRGTFDAEHIMRSAISTHINNHDGILKVRGNLKNCEFQKGE